jgi:hypothetical protein
MTVRKYTVSHGTATDDSLDTILCHPKAMFPFNGILDFCGKQLEAELKSPLAIAIAVRISLVRLLTYSSIHRLEGSTTLQSYVPGLGLRSSSSPNTMLRTRVKLRSFHLTTPLE